MHLFSDTELKEIAINDKAFSEAWLHVSESENVTKLDQYQAIAELRKRNIVKNLLDKIARLEKENPEMENQETMPIAYALGKKRAFEETIESLKSMNYFNKEDL